MGNAPIKQLPSSFDIVSSYDPNQALPKDVLLLILAHVSDLRDFAHCMRSCRLFYNYCNREESWTRQLSLHAEREFPGRRFWAGYQINPCFLDAEWEDVRKSPILFEALRERTFGQLEKISRRDVFASKKMIRERFDLFSGWGSLLLNHFVEGFFFRGSVLLGSLYDMMHDPPRIVYSGLLFQGKRHGALGVSYFPDGTVSYKGSWSYDFQHGIGKTFWKNSGLLQYEGSFKRGVKEGIGKQHWATGCYEGEWRNDMPHGNGCWTWKDGAKFVGQMREGKRHGFGILFYGREKKDSNGNEEAKIEYEGNWEDDLLNGKAKRYSRDGVLRYEGEFLNGLKNGIGKSYTKSGVLSYEGEYQSGKKHGTGRLYDVEGRMIYEGDFVRGLFHGRGKLGEEGVESDFRNGGILMSKSLDESMGALVSDDDAE